MDATASPHLDRASLEAGVDDIRSAPPETGTLRLIVRRPSVDAREILELAELDLDVGLVGDTWKDRPSSRTPDGSPHPDMQLNLMSARSIALIAGSSDRWALAGDQLYIDLDLSAANLPAGTRLSIGSAEIEVTPQPHTGCAKFSARFGSDALRFVNSPEGRDLRLRGICAKVTRPGTIRAGDAVRKLRP
jgi:hypothetical protein